MLSILGFFPRQVIGGAPTSKNSGAILANHKLYRYFEREEYADAFLDGRVYCHNLQYYVNIEDGEVRGDAKDGSLVHQPSQGLEINNLSQGTKFTITDAHFNATANIEDIYALCMSQSLNSMLIEKFKAAFCVEILAKRPFLHSIRSELERRANFVKIGRLTYYHPSRPPLGRWADPEQICMSKNEDYRWQDEYRVAFGSPENFAAYAVTTTITQANAKADGKANRQEKETTFNIGSIRGYAVKRQCR